MRKSIPLAVLLVCACLITNASARRPGLAAHPLAVTAQFLVPDSDTDVAPRLPSPDGPAISEPLAIDGTDCQCETPCESECCPRPCCSCCCLPRFYGYAEALFLNRDNESKVRPIVIDTSVPASGDNTLLRTSDLTFSNEPGVRVLLGYQINQCHAIEFGYFSIFDWHGSATITGDDNLAIPGDLGLASNDYYNADVMRVDYSSTINSFETNWLWTHCCCEEAVPCCSPRRMRVSSWFVGFRYLNLDEQFNIRPTDLDEGTSDYNVRTENDLYGAQIGARVRSMRDRWGLELIGKAGIYGNSAEQIQYVTDFPPPFELRSEQSHRAGNVAFVGELGFSLFYQLTEHMGIRGGYNLMWLEGVALAPDQLDFTFTSTSGTHLDSTGGLFLHGASVGVEAYF